MVQLVPASSDIDPAHRDTRRLAALLTGSALLGLGGLGLRPDLVVVNAPYMRHFAPGTPRARFVDSLRSGSAGYQLAARFTWRPAWLPLTWDAPFRDDREDPFTNLDKVSPEIEVYRRER